MWRTILIKSTSFLHRANKKWSQAELTIDDKRRNNYHFLRFPVVNPSAVELRVIGCNHRCPHRSDVWSGSEWEQIRPVIRIKLLDNNLIFIFMNTKHPFSSHPAWDDMNYTAFSMSGRESSQSWVIVSKQKSLVHYKCFCIIVCR